MAFTTKYRGTFYTSSGATIKVDIQKDGYSGSILPIKVKDVNISHNWNDYFEPAIGAGCEVEIVNNNSQWDYYDELLTAYEKEFKMLVYFTDDTLTNFVLFEGYLLSEVQEQKILWNSVISLKASNYIKQLDGLNTIAAYNEASLVTPMRVIAQILTKIGLGYDIYVNCSLYETGMFNNQLLSELLVQKHFFSEDDEPAKLLAALNKLLKPFSLYIYGFNQKWYIERYGDLYESGSDNTYLKYNPSTYGLYTSSGSANLVKSVYDGSPEVETDSITSDYIDAKTVTVTIYGFREWAGISVDKTITAINSITGSTLDVSYTYSGNSYTGSSSNVTVGSISYVGDDLTFEVASSTNIFSYLPDKLDSVTLGNLTINYSYTAPITSVETPSVLTAGTDFEYVNQSQTLQYGRGYKNITVKLDEKDGHNTVNEYFGDATPITKTSVAPYVFERWSYDSSGSITVTGDKVQFNHTVNDLYRGLYTRIVIKGADSSLKINYRREFTAYELNMLNLYPNQIKQTDLYFNIIIAGSSYQLQKTDGVWAIVSKDLSSGSFTAVTSYKYDDDGGYYYWELNESIDLTPFNLATGTTLEIRILGCASRYADSIYDHLIYNPVYRKIKITQDVSEEEVVLEGDISNNYSGTLSVDLNLFDTTKSFGLNAMFLSATIPPTPTTKWLDRRTGAESPTRELTLQEHLLEDLYQLHNKPRKKLVASIKFDKPLKPFSIIRDNNILRDGNVINMTLVKYSLNVPTMTYDIEADEYVTNDNLKIV